MSRLFFYRAFLLAYDDTYDDVYVIEMIKVNLVCVGRVKEKYFAEGIEEYSKRLGKFCVFKIIEIEEENYKKTNHSITDTIKEKEGEGVLRALSGYVIACTIDGKKYSSEALAGKIENLALSGVSEITFVIGGSYGLSEKVIKRSDERISFSDMTFPHTLFRLMFCEQLYRAFTINANLPYHK